MTATTTREESPTSTVVVSDWIRYTEGALSVVEENYLWRDRIDWVSIREEAINRVRAAPTVNGAHQALRDAISSSNDSHSQFLLANSGTQDSGPLKPPEGQSLEGAIGYLSVPSMAGNDAELRAYATELQEAMRRIDSGTPVCGWVVDLRGNGGGSIFGMLLGLGPLLGGGVVVRRIYGVGPWGHDF
jgi:carboxyl-terminal processing protease